MDQEGVLIESLSIGGYRSFGNQIQRFEKFSKVNLFIGRNNSGKSNILRFLHYLYPSFSKKTPLNLDRIDSHIPLGAKFLAGTSISLEKDGQGNFSEFYSVIAPRIKNQGWKNQAAGYVLRVLQEKAKIDNTSSAWFDFDLTLRLVELNWKSAFDLLGDSEIRFLWQALVDKSGGGRDQHWYPESLNALQPHFKSIRSEMIPAIRQVGKQGTISETFGGEGIIERLVKLQNPDVHNQHDREKFNHINEFLRKITDNQTAEIEIPHQRNTILVHMDGKTLPLESLGTGIHQVIILAAAATIPTDTVICIEEPELHLNPILQKKLIRYLFEVTSNQYFITTHSAALMDTPGAEIYHISLENNQSNVKRVTSSIHRSAICEDLGYHPSDLLQSNCIIWVEGPSDRIYLNYWINTSSTVYVEGIHYSIMFYGGRLASHLSGEDIDEIIEDFISLRRLNRRSVIVIDSDSTKAGAAVNATKHRLKEEFDAGPGYTWITAGREIENYIAPDQLKEAIKKTRPSAKALSKFGRYDNCLSILTKSEKKSMASKVDIAKFIVNNFFSDLTLLDLKDQVERLIGFIRESNPGVRFDEK
ncbi:ATP-dependent endonuclease [Nitrosovibrio sp. Nv6]|uniref:ATP-dependent nuclease n=1 Tax=Nitrosovibrio sp. Nv6 TaxID=1855340 RepID=UPI0008CD3BBB|nr:ATP-binding protein [Nitrosovibrio sp. Nv6]SEO61849.1 Predicted ATP-dependent endonuclease of the OLD family, contains P-loop ATPase and TOPRIM domains [Nitrosovibrio sp. Nv6]